MLSKGDKVWCTFTLYNILSLVFGVLVTGVAAWIVADRSSFFYITQLDELDGESSPGSFIEDGAIVVLGIGVAILIQSLVGCLGASLGCGGRGRGCLLTYGSILFIVIVLEITAVVLVLTVYMKEVGDEIKSYLESSLKDYLNPGTGVSVIWDNMMEGLGCCGANNFTDFQHLYTGSQVIPEACCIRNGTQLLDPSCIEVPTEQIANLDGCVSMLAPSAVPALALTAAVVVVFQIAGVILSCCLGRQVEEKREWYEMTSL